ncbi:MAG: phosphotransferase [Oscillospiraceae bacterium]|nr:phosphotransferase [Oscillospiraceae bacterium]
MEYCPGKEAGDAFPEMTPAERAVFAGKVRDLLKKMNHPVDIIPRDLKKQAMENERLDRLHPALAAGLRERVMDMDLSGGVLVHGDCTGENLLVDEKGDPILIDFADCSIAPEWYELPAAVFELFRCDSTALEILQGNESPDSFLEKLFDGLAVHDFGGDIIRTWFEREGILVDEISSVPQLKLLLGQKLRGEGCITGHFPHTVFPDLTGDPVTDAKILCLANGKSAASVHMEEVAETAAGLAERFGADIEKCRTAALLHDIAAVLPRE